MDQTHDADLRIAHSPTTLRELAVDRLRQAIISGRFSGGDRLVERTLRMEGTCSGEHGVGLHKMGFLLDEAGPAAVGLMREIKRALDPKNILNPGKVFVI